MACGRDRHLHRERRCALHHGVLLSPAQEDVANRRDGRPVIQDVGAFGDRPRTLDGLRFREKRHVACRC